MYYNPLQTPSRPSLDRRGQIQYREYMPRKPLRPFIADYSTATSVAPVQTTFLHRIVPDGCVNIVFDLSDTSNQLGFVAGPLTEVQFVSMTEQVQIVGIRFFPGTALHFLAAHIQDIANRSVPLDDIFEDTDARIISERLAEERYPEKRISILEEYIAGHFREDAVFDPTLGNALHIIYRHKGNIQVSELARRLHVSQRQLGRKFNAWIGMSPKAFCRVVRFQRTLRVLPGASAKDFISVALESGYYDQSHFIQEFHSMYGLSPSRFKAMQESSVTTPH